MSHVYLTGSLISKICTKINKIYVAIFLYVYECMCLLELFIFDDLLKRHFIFLVICKVTFIFIHIPGIWEYTLFFQSSSDATEIVYLEQCIIKASCLQSNNAWIFVERMAKKQQVWRYVITTSLCKIPLGTCSFLWASGMLVVQFLTLMTLKISNILSIKHLMEIYPPINADK